MASPRARPQGELRQLSRLAGPMALVLGGQSSMALLETAIVARAGAEALSAAALANTLLTGVTSFCAGVVLGIEPLMAQAFGAGDAARARRLLGQGHALAAAAGLLAAAALAAVLWRLPELPRIEEWPAARDYLLVRLPALPLSLLYVAGRSYLLAAHRPRALVLAAALGNAVTLAGGILLVFGGAGLPALGARGAALAGLLGTLVQWGTVAPALRAGRAPGAARRFQVDGAELRRILRLGAPIGAHMTAQVGILVLVGWLARALGQASMDAYQVALTCANVPFTAALGIGHAGSVRVGWAVGAGEAVAARLRGRLALLAGAAAMAAAALVLGGFPGAIAALMGAPPGAAPLVARLLAVTAALLLSDGVQVVAVGVLRGMGDTRFPVLAVAVGHWLLGLPLALLLAFDRGLGVVGLWWGLSAGFGAVALLLLWRFERLCSRALAAPGAGAAQGHAGEVIDRSSRR